MLSLFHGSLFPFPPAKRVASPLLPLYVAAALIDAVPTICQAAPIGTVEAVCFSPEQDCAELIIQEIGQAQREILVSAYEFTHKGIAQALAAAQTKGRDVRVIIDDEKSRDRYSVVGYLVSHGVPVYLDRVHHIQHQKTMTFDGQRVETGSFNYTRAAATENSENAEILAGPDVGAHFRNEWIRLVRVSTLIQPARR